MGYYIADCFDRENFSTCIISFDGYYLDGVLRVELNYNKNKVFGDFLECVSRNLHHIGAIAVNTNISICFCLDKEKIDSVQYLLEQFSLEYIDFMALIKLFPIDRGTEIVKRKLLGVASLCRISHLDIDNGNIGFIIKNEELITNQFENMLDCELLKLATEQEKFCTDIFMGSLCVYGMKGLLKKYMKVGTVYDMLCNMIEYLKEYPY